MTEILDHGYLRHIEHWGSDERIIESARMSTAKGFQGWGPLCVDCCSAEAIKNPIPNPGNALSCSKCGCGGLMYRGDEKLLRFLWENKHSTPFEMAGLTIEVKAPIMVFREWHRHRVPFGYNEMSARYVPLPNENYSPTVERIISGATGAGGNKQAQSVDGKIPTEQDCLAWLADLADVYEQAERVYKAGIAIGVPKELARLPVPVARYSCMRATANLRGWLAFLQLRTATVAQWEIQQYAWAVADLISEQFPRTYELWAESGARP